LYTTTWGTANILDASLNNHGKNYILQIRAFVEAVLAYTKAPYVDIISHSMGVTIARKVAQGGTATDQRYGTYNVGPSLKAKIRNFVGIAGGNLGLTACWT
jgi:triacylglycerol lipase